MEWTVIVNANFHEHEIRLRSTKDFGIARLGPAIEEFINTLDEYTDSDALAEVMRLPI